MEDTIALTFFDSLTNTNGSREWLSWNQLIEHFNDFSVGTDKNQLPAFSPTVFAANRRKKANVEAVTALVLDYDDGTPIAEGIAPFEGLDLRFMVYSSFNHRRVTDKKPSRADRYRVMLPLSEPIPPDKYPDLWRWANEITDGKIDSACKDAGRLFFMPGVANEDSEREFIVNEGNALDWRILNLATEEETPSIISFARHDGNDELLARIPRETVRLLAGEPPTEEYKTSSELEMAIIVPLVRAGFDDESIGEILQDGQHDSKYQRLCRVSIGSAQVYLSGSIANARKLPHTREFETAQELADAISRCILRMTWNGRAGMTDRAVLLAHCTTMRRSGKLAYHASVREVAEYAQCSPSTASKSHKRLITAGFLTPCSRFREVGGGASSYRLNARKFRIGNTQSKRKSNLLPHNSLLLTECSISGKSALGGVFEDRLGLGKSGQLIYEALLSAGHGLTPKEIQSLSTRALSTIYKKLPIMELLGLIGRLPDGRRYYAVADVDWEAVGEQMGTLDIADRRRERHERDRENYRSRGTFYNPSVAEHIAQYYPEVLMGQPAPLEPTQVANNTTTRPMPFHNGESQQWGSDITI